MFWVYVQLNYSDASNNMWLSALKQRTPAPGEELPFKVSRWVIVCGMNHANPVMNLVRVLREQVASRISAIFSEPQLCAFLIFFNKSMFITVIVLLSMNSIQIQLKYSAIFCLKEYSICTVLYIFSIFSYSVTILINILI